MTKTPVRIVANVVDAALESSLRLDGVKLERKRTTTGSEVLVLTLRTGEKFNITITKARS